MAWRPISMSHHLTAVTDSCVCAGNRVQLGPLSMSRKAAGTCAAVYVGIMNGSFMAPLEMASRHVSAREYFVSFGIAAMLLTALLVAAANLVWWLQGKPLARWHFWVVAPPGLLTGCLWTAGYVASILATEALGMAVAYPAIQAQLVVSSLWGILYYRELTTRASVVLLLASTLALSLGIAAMSEAVLGD